MTGSADDGAAPAATGPGDPAVSVRGVSKQFTARGRASLAVRDVSFDAPRGQITCLIGRSGCGKSTILNMVAGTIRPTEGSVRHHGREVTAVNPEVAYLPQGDNLFAWRTVLDNISLPLELQGVKRAERHERAARLVETFGLSGREKSYPAQLSGGMRKRVQIARALLTGAETLLMDEPFGALDAQLKVRMQIDLLERVHQASQNTILFVTHDLAEAVALGDQVVVFSASPGTVVHVEEINDLPDRVDVLSAMELPEFQAHVHKLWTLIAPELLHPSNSVGAPQ
jgi:NitT/TauT family transport system ATP-binding protein